MEKHSLDRLSGRKEFFAQVRQRLDAGLEEEMCIVAADIEHLKLFNEWYGQETGDMLLENIATYLLELRKSKEYIVGYFGADDFFLFMPVSKGMIQELYRALCQYLNVVNGIASFFPALGIYEIQDPAMKVSSMCNNAQIACAATKENYGKRICYFDDRMIQRMEHRQKLLTDVRRGIENKEFTFYVQPKCEITEGKIIEFEALTRWNHPQFGIISPERFLPVLEACGLITRLDLYIWEEVCRVLGEWKKNHRRCLPISINVSIIDMKNIDVPETLQKLIRKYDLTPDLLPVEVTESAFAENVEEVRCVVERLHEMGFQILMDDFGSGYSSLNMLKDLYVDVLKTDMKFLDLDGENQGKGENIVEAVIRMAHMMNLRIVAEGVEKQSQVDFLKLQECNYVQGFYFYKPMPVEQAMAIVERNEVVDWDGIQPLRKKGYYPEGFLEENELISVLTREYYKILLANWTQDSFEVIKNDEKIYEKRNVRFGGLEQWLQDLGLEGNIHEEDLEQYEQFVNRDNMMHRLLKQKENVGCNYRKKVNGTFRWVRMEFIRDAQYQDENQSGILLVKDMDESYSEHLRHQEELEYSSSHDALTGLYNRMKYEKSIRVWKKRKYTSVCSVYIDAIGLHEINNHLGHEAGDHMLTAVSDAIRRHFPGDYGYRIGGDEFTILIFDREQEWVEAQLKELKRELQKKEYEVSVGVAWRQGVCSIAELTDLAEARMRKDKADFYRSNGYERKMRSLNMQLENILTEQKDVNQFLQAISDSFKGVYFVNPKADRVRYIFIPPYFEKLLEQCDQKYGKALEMYADEFVKEEYREPFKQLLDYEVLQKRLLHADCERLLYQKVTGEWVEVQVLDCKKEHQESELLWIFLEESSHTGKPGGLS